MRSKKVGEIIRIEWNKDEDSMRVIFEITDKTFRAKILHNSEFDDILMIDGKDAVIVASNDSNGD